MRPFSCVTWLGSLFLSAAALSAPGYQWEMRMEMVGMPFPMPAVKICAPKASNEPPVTKDDGDCKILEKKLTGNRYRWKAQCKEGLMEGDVTSTPTSYNGAMKMTDKSGNAMSMKMSGKRLGDCDYQDRSDEIKAMKEQAEGLVAQMCKEAMENMQGQMLITGQCPKEKIIFCQRLATPEGYDKATQNIPADLINNPVSGVTQVVQGCGLSNATLLPKLCAKAVSGANFDFVGRLCPTEKPKLCAKALTAGQANYVGANCPTEKAALVKKHCEGRRYTSQIDAKYRDFCAAVASGGEFRTERPATPEPAPTAAPSSSSIIPTDVEDGIKKLKGMFGF